MELQLFLSTTLRRYVEGYRPATGLRVEAEADITVKGLCRRLGIPPGKVKLVMVDGVARPPESRLHGGERVALFPPVGGG